MLIIVLLLVLVAFGLLVAALTTANTLFAWISVAVSVAAAVLLVVDWVQTRRRKQGDADAGPAAADDEPDEDDTPDEDEPEPPAQAAVDPPGDEPAEEATDAADRLVVSELTAEVRVLDERPRYHLAKCAFISGRPSLSLPVSEARDLGFTPCALCTPDAVLAARHRKEAKGAAEGATPEAE
ncbi:hypothetical protein [Actinokineospora bangkokensis]|uniref:Uncharacterized protein n=1 Tax=Actinokineospora bangkokensis TaxID=1193682 RepID=A0A1Q9LQA0_9PSEU|nr:hypothetical protein [Actinokineospora bangkokensis]OLR94202.1 hypothetical protein BJP25_10435 [Actinokineospora bangkokensis]